VRRSDAALAFVDVPSELALELGHFIVEAVVANAAALRAVVSAALQYAEPSTTLKSVTRRCAMERRRRGWVPCAISAVAARSVWISASLNCSRRRPG
jgi:3-hydroxyacyl-CoA dehydrogenase